jgi:hypothetical protein
MTETRYAHEIVPEPADDAPLADLARYHLACAQGFFAGLMESRAFGDMYVAMARSCLADAHLGFLYHHLARGLSGQEAANRVYQEIGDGENIGEWLRQYLTEHDIEPASIRAYTVRRSHAEGSGRTA